jgi:hypothetical protein
VFGESLTRVGWDDSEAQAASPRGQQSVPTAGSKDEPRLAPIECQLTDREWQRLGLGASPPTADQAALGSYAWFVVADDPSTTEVVVWRARRESLVEQAAVEKRQLLTPLSDPAHFAYLASLQVEGAAAIRYRIPERVGASIGRVEVAWEDVIHGMSQRVVLPEAGPYRNDDTAKIGEAAERAVPALISVTHGGLYLQIHGESSRDQATLFLDAQGVHRLPEMSWPDGLARARGEFVRVGNSHQPILFLGSTAVVRASPHANSWTFLAHSVGWADPESFGSDQTLALGYWQGRPALHLGWSEPNVTSASAVVLPFREQGGVFAEPMVVPTQADLASVPQTCEPQAFADTPRVVAEPLWGTRHVVTVSDGGESFALLTGAAVLHGSKQQPCTAAFEAEAMTHRRDDVHSGIITIDAPERSWLFRRTKDAALEYRRMSCDVSAPSP